MYGIYCYENGVLIDKCESLEEAKETLAFYEECDINEGVYTPGFYEIKKINDGKA